MGRKKKSSSSSTAAATATATATATAVPATSKASEKADAVGADEDMEEIEEEESMELIQVDTGDMVKLKQVLDETVAGTFVESMDLKEDHRLDNIKLSIMTLACLFAVVAQFSPMPFPDSRPLLGVCCCAYFLLSGILQLIATYLDRDAIMVTLPVGKDNEHGKKNGDMKKYGLRIRTSLPRFDEYYTLVIEFQGLKDSSFVKKTWSVGKFFDVEGMFDEIGLMEEVEAVFKKFEKGDYDTEETDLKKKNQ